VKLLIELKKLKKKIKLAKCVHLETKSMKKWDYSYQNCGACLAMKVNKSLHKYINSQSHRPSKNNRIIHTWLR
jgi:hypothetical protein